MILVGVGAGGAVVDDDDDFHCRHCMAGDVESSLFDKYHERCHFQFIVAASEIRVCLVRGTSLSLQYL